MSESVGMFVIANVWFAASVVADDRWRTGACLVAGIGWLVLAKVWSCPRARMERERTQ
jgi:hypothetical protein